MKWPAKAVQFPSRRAGLLSRSVGPRTHPAGHLPLFSCLGLSTPSSGLTESGHMVLLSLCSGCVLGLGTGGGTLTPSAPGLGAVLRLLCQHW